MNKDDYKAREIIQNRVVAGMLGPGSDVWGLPIEEEIISDIPLKRYFTGILFPEQSKVESQEEFDDKQTESETSEVDDEQSMISDVVFEDKDKDSKPDTKVIINDENYKLNHNTFFPTNMGLTFCVSKSEKYLNVKFQFGTYFQPTVKEKIIKISEDGYNSFFDESIEIPLSFRDKLVFENGFMSLSKPLEGNTGGRKKRSGEYKNFDEFRKFDNTNEKPVKNYISHLERLISRAWRRQSIELTEEIEIKSTKQPIILSLQNDKNKKLEIGYHIKVIKDGDVNYVKIQFINLSEPHPQNKFSNANEELNKKCIFQAKIQVQSDKLKSYKTIRDKITFDKEAEEINFIYRKINKFGVGHNCSIDWNDDTNPTRVETTFIPTVDVKDRTNKIEDKTQIKSFQDALNIKNLSIYGKEKNTVIDSLNLFVNQYEQWIGYQKVESKELSNDETVIAKRIINRQVEIKNKLKENIQLLETNQDVWNAFQLMNLSMFIQFVISDKFPESELTNNYEKINLEYFKKYDEKQFEYRPFQLAFILLNLDSIVKPECESRKNIVDLIWFPTGGGKTEAYLAVAVFTMIWRRMNNETGYEGTTVIMRYTLRLLTAQQFERASRIITVLEYLRHQDEFTNWLKEEPFSIGLWVGQSTTPNKLKDAKDIYTKIESECKRKNGNPHKYNSFQVSFCPWCGTKLLSKVAEIDEWNYGFKYKRNDFIFHCINNRCHFHKKLPIQVIDDILYNNPPTLLFGTVDKFAMLSWREESYRFFNTHDDKLLPPDLIIQDELHLLNGPLGSLTGLFESVIELLCTKNGVAPKYIASTATTRNTDSQVKNLYDRKVRVFPPSGINQGDSFFSKESSDKSKRRYLGILPTGKTPVDTQLFLLAHLLLGRLEVYAQKDKFKNIFTVTDNYWTLVSYYNSLRDVGRTSNKVSDEIKTYLGALLERFSLEFDDFNKNYNFSFYGLSNRTEELTSRIQSEKIKSTLSKIEANFDEDKLQNDEKGYMYLNGVVDMVLATNMISVGIDISRLNIMLMNGIPRNIAEYIQASSRIGRETYGLGVVLHSSMRARDKSYFENFKAFNQSYYQFVEPLSVTPFTENTIRKLSASLIVSFLRNYFPGELNKNKYAIHFIKEYLDEFRKMIDKRYAQYPSELNFIEKVIEDIKYDWVNAIDDNENLKFSDYFVTPQQKNIDNEEKVLMQSLREIDTETFIQVKECK